MYCQHFRNYLMHADFDNLFIDMSTPEVVLSELRLIIQEARPVWLNVHLDPTYPEGGYCDVQLALPRAAQGIGALLLRDDLDDNAKRRLILALFHIAQASKWRHHEIPERLLKNKHSRIGAQKERREAYMDSLCSAYREIDQAFPKTSKWVKKEGGGITLTKWIVPDFNGVFSDEGDYPLPEVQCPSEYDPDYSSGDFL